MSETETSVRQVSEEIDRLLHDAQHAEGGASMAMMMGDKKYAAEGIAKRDRLIAEARTLHKDNPGARWPDPEDCEWPSVERPMTTPPTELCACGLASEVQRLRAELSRYHELWDNDEINIIADMHEHYTPIAASVAIKQLLTLCAGLRAERDKLAEALKQIARNRCQLCARTSPTTDYAVIYEDIPFRHPENGLFYHERRNPIPGGAWKCTAQEEWAALHELDGK